MHVCAWGLGGRKKVGDSSHLQGERAKSANLFRLQRSLIFSFFLFVYVCVCMPVHAHVCVYVSLCFGSIAG